MFKKLYLLFCIFVLMFSISFVGCSSKNKRLKENGIKVSSWSFSLGEANNTDLLNKTRFSYSIYLVNNNQQDVFVSSVKPIINDSIKNKVLSNNLSIKVDKNISPNRTIKIKGDIIVDTNGLDKSQITKLEPFITDIKVSLDEILKLKN